MERASRDASIEAATSGSKRAIVAWCLFDWANSAFPTVIVTFLFSTYFTTAVAPSRELGALLWGQVNSLSAFAAAIAAPIFGAIADQGGRRKPWLFAFSVLCISGTASLWFVRPEASYVIFALVTYAVATLGFELALVFYNAMLADLVGPDHVGRVSGWGWGVGYLGGLACLVLSLVLIVQPEPSLLDLDRATAEHVRATYLFAAAWFALFAVPIFIFVRDRESARMAWSSVFRSGIAALIATVRRLGGHRNIAIFLCAKMIYIDGVNTLFVFGGVYAVSTFGMSFDEVLIFGIALNVAAGLGAIGFSWVDDWLGAKPTILLALVAMTVLGTATLTATSQTVFTVLSVMLSVFVGPVQAASRSLLARLAPPESRAEFFGLFTLAGKATAFAGPALVGWVTLASGSHRAGMATILPFFVVGAALLLVVKESRS